VGIAPMSLLLVIALCSAVGWAGIVVVCLSMWQRGRRQRGARAAATEVLLQRIAMLESVKHGLMAATEDVDAAEVVASAEAIVRDHQAHRRHPE
jgi:hypothetical protein